MSMRLITLLCIVVIGIASCSPRYRSAKIILPIAESTGSVEYGGLWYKFTLAEILACGGCDSTEYVDGLAYYETVGDYHLFGSFHKQVDEGKTTNFALHRSECIVEDDCVEGPNCHKYQFRWAIRFSDIFIVRGWPPRYPSERLPLVKNAIAVVDSDTSKYYVFPASDLSHLEPVYMGSNEKYHLFRTFRGWSARKNETTRIAILRSSCKVVNERSQEKEKEYILSEMRIRVARYIDGKFVVPGD